MSTPTRRLGRWMEQARERYGWTRDELHARSGGRVTARQQLALIKGERDDVQRATLEAMAKAFGVAEFDLRRVMHGEDVPIPERPPARVNSSQGSDGVTDEQQRLQRDLDDLRRRYVELDAKVDLILRRLDRPAGD